MVAAAVASSAGHMLKMADGVRGSAQEVAVMIKRALVVSGVVTRWWRPGSGAAVGRSLGLG